MDDLRSSGRTTRIVVDSLSKALANPGVPIAIVDHCDCDLCNLSAARRVCALLDELDVGYTFISANKTITVDPLGD